MMVSDGVVVVLLWSQAGGRCRLVWLAVAFDACDYVAGGLYAG